MARSSEADAPYAISERAARAERMAEKLVSHMGEAGAVPKVTRTNAGTAPLVYNRDYVQSVADMANENKARINDLIDKLKAAGVIQ